MMKRALAVAVLFAATAGIAIGQPAAPPPPGGSGKTQGETRPAPSPALFEKAKAEMIKNQQARTQILQNAEACLQAAQNMNQLRACHQQERAAQKQLHEKMEQERESMRGGPPTK